MYKSHISILSTHTHSYSSSIRKGSRDCIFACLCCTLRLKRAQTKGNTNIWMWRELLHQYWHSGSKHCLTETAHAKRATQVWFSPTPYSSHSPNSTGLWQIVSGYYLWPGFLMNLGYFTTQQIRYTSSQGEGLFPCIMQARPHFYWEGRQSFGQSACRLSTPHSFQYSPKH